LYQIYCILIRYFKEFHTRVEIILHGQIESAENDVAKGKITEQQYIKFCNMLKNRKEVINTIIKYYKDDRNIYFIKNPDKDGITISIHTLPNDDDNFVKYMFNFDMERRRCIALKVKQAEDERKAKQAADDEALIQTFQEQKAKEKKSSIQDLTRQANKKRAKEEKLRKDFEKSAAEKELEKLKDKKKKQQKKSKA